MRITGSKLGLAESCLYWAREDAAWSPNVSSESASLGTDFHRAIAEIISAHSVSAPVDIMFSGSASMSAEVKALVQAWCEHYKPRLGWRAEVAYAFDTVTGAARELGVDIGRDYAAAGALPHDICGSADLVYMQDETVVVVDWKTGAQQHTKPAAENAQLRFLAACAASSYGATSARVVVAYVSADGVRESVAELDDFTLLSLIPAELTAYADALRGSPAPAPGAHCAELWCPAIASCPATHAAAATLVPEPDDHRHLPIVADRAAIKSAAHAASIWRRLTAIDAMGDVVWRELDAWVDEHGPIDLGDGREYRAIEEARESITVDGAALKVLDESFGTRSGEVLKTTCTKTAIADLARSVAGRGKGGAELERQVLSALRAEGSMKEKMITKHAAVKARKTEAA